MNSNYLIDYLEEINLYYKINNENFKSKAITNAMNILIRQPFIKSGKEAMKLKGIGKGIAKKIDYIIEHKSIPEEYKIKEIKSYKLFLGISFVGPIRASKWIQKQYTKLSDIPESEQIHAIKIGIKHYDDFQKKIPRALIENFEENLQKSVELRNLKISWKITGSYRREKSESGDIDILIDHNIDRFILFLKKSEYITETLAHGTHKFEGVMKLGEQACRIDIYQTTKSSWPFGLLYFTGSKFLNIKMRNKAVSKGYKLSEYGLENYKGEINSEEDIFKALDMEYVELHNR